ncbi:hypothetical protein O181_082122, partial [Austropuccinia psidii MF-1]|nr:hypothetical protein [Austropuccinia psidii MF-1]
MQKGGKKEKDQTEMGYPTFWNFQDSIKVFVTAKEAGALPIMFNNHYFIDTPQNPISKVVSFNILQIQFSDLNTVSYRQDPNTGFTKYRLVINTGVNNCIDCITCIGFTNPGFNPTSNFFQHTDKYLNTQTPRL